MVDSSKTWRPLSLLGAVLVALGTVGVPVAKADFLLPINLSGWNGDVVTDANAGTRFAQRFDAGAAAWFEAGAGGHPDGLPSGQNFTSAANPNTTFHLLPANGNNVLRLGDGSVGNTLTLATTARYSSLAILAASGSSFGLNTGTLIIHFSDGTSSSSLSYNAFDWNELTAGVAPFVALGDLGRNGDIGAGTGFTYNRPHAYALYETDIDLSALGLNGKDVQSITFTQASGAFVTGIFAVSGQAVPEPAGLMLLGIGVASLMGYTWRGRRSKLLPSA